MKSLFVEFKFEMVCKLRFLKAFCNTKKQEIIENLLSPA